MVTHELLISVIQLISVCLITMIIISWCLSDFTSPPQHPWFKKTASHVFLNRSPPRLGREILKRMRLFRCQLSTVNCQLFSAHHRHMQPALFLTLVFPPPSAGPEIFAGADSSCTWCAADAQEALIM